MGDQNSSINNDDEAATNFKKQKIINESGNQKTPVKECGYGWVITFASFMCHFIADGISFGFGVLYPDLLEQFNGTRSQTAWIGSLFFGVPLICAPIAGLCVNRYGCRITTIIGALISSISLIISSFVTSIGAMCITYGVMAGFGLAFIYVPASVIPSFWFEKRRALATGLAVSGSGVGTFALAPLIEKLLREYTWRGTLLIIGGITMNAAIFGALFKEPPQKELFSSSINPSSENGCDDQQDAKHLQSCNSSSGLKNMRYSSVNTLCSVMEFEPLKHTSTRRCHEPNEISGISESCPSMQTANGSHNAKRTLLNEYLAYAHSKRSIIPLSRRDISSVLTLAELNRNAGMIRATSCPALSLSPMPESSSMSSSNLKNVCKHAVCKVVKLSRELCDLSLLKVPVYLLFFVSNMLLCVAYEIPFIYLPDYAKQNEITRASFLVSIIGIVNTVGQIIYGYFGDKRGVDVIAMYGVNILICGILVCFIPLLTTYGWLAAFSVGFGFALSASFVLETVVVIQVLSLNQLTSAYSLLMCGQGIASLVGPPCAGLLFDITKEYTYTFIFSGISIIMAGFLALAILITRGKRFRTVSDSSDFTFYE